MGYHQSFFDQLFEFSIYLDALTSILNDLFNVLFLWSGNHLYNYVLVLGLNLYYFNSSLYIPLLLLTNCYLVYLYSPLISFKQRLDDASDLQSFWKGSPLKIIWTFFYLFSENDPNPITSTVLTAIGGSEAIGNIDPQLALLRKKKDRFQCMISNFLFVMKKVQFLCDTVDCFIDDPFLYLFQIKFWLGCLLAIKFSLSHAILVCLNVVLLWNCPLILFIYGIMFYLYQSFSKVYVKNYFSTVLIARNIFKPVQITLDHLHQLHNEHVKILQDRKFYVRFPCKSELHLKKLFYFDLYENNRTELIRVLYAYENERWWPAIGWTASLRSTDRRRFSDDTGSYGSLSLDAIEARVAIVFPKWLWLDSNWKPLTFHLFNPSSHDLRIPEEILLDDISIPLVQSDDISVPLTQPDAISVPTIQVHSLWEYYETSSNTFKFHLDTPKEGYKLRRRFLFKRLTLDPIYFSKDF